MHADSKYPFSPRRPGPALASTIALFGALGLMGFSAGAQAGAVAPSPPGCTRARTIERSSQVTDLVTDDGADTWSYEFRVCNTTDSGYGGNLLRDWELPWDPNAGIDQSSIATPDGWAWSIEERDEPNGNTGWDGTISWQDVGPDGIPGTADDDPFFNPAFATQPFVLHFYTSCSGEGGVSDTPAGSNQDLSCFDLANEWLVPGEDLAGFSFTATASPVSAPYQASWFELPPISGDPAFPLGSGTALTPSFFVAASVPEPSSLLLLGASLGGLSAAALARRRRKRDEDDTAQDS
jgi:hypothetical protein